MVKGGGMNMKWEEVRNIFPNRFVKMQILQQHIDGDKRVIDEVAVIKEYEDEKEATKELVRTKEDTIVYHTGKEKLEIEIKEIFGFRGIV